MKLIGICLLVLVVGMSTSNVARASDCTPSTPLGYCAGPQDRSVAMSKYLAETNSGCKIDEVSYYVDESETTVKCGECTPGTAGWNDPSHSCKLNEYCTDQGKCAPIEKSPFYKKDCPYETGTLVSFCGAGLRCYQHKCLPCMNGMVDYSDGKMCVGNEWTYSRWQAIRYNPGDLLILLIFVFLLVAILVPLLYKAWVKFGEKRAVSLWARIRGRK